MDVQNGVIAQRLDYDEWGNVTSDTNPGFQPFGFAGGLYDPDTGLVRFGYRDYDPTVGRWLAKDPILFTAGGVNLYQYCNGNPINYVDYLGLQQLRACYREQSELRRELAGSNSEERDKENERIIRGATDTAVDLLFAVPGVVLDPVGTVVGAVGGDVVEKTADFLAEPDKGIIEYIKNLPQKFLMKFIKGFVKYMCYWPDPDPPPKKI